MNRLKDTDTYFTRLDVKITLGKFQDENIPMTPETVGTFQSVAHFLLCFWSGMFNSGSPNVLQSHPLPLAFMLCPVVPHMVSWSCPSGKANPLVFSLFPLHYQWFLLMEILSTTLVRQPRASLWACHYFCQVYYCWPWFHSQQFFRNLGPLRTVSISPPWLASNTMLQI